jgi:hypothetical protein
MKTCETKTFVKIFCEAFLIFKNYFASTIQDLYFHFYKKGFLNSQAVRIRVNPLKGGRGPFSPPFFLSCPYKKRAVLKI